MAPFKYIAEDRFLLEAELNVDDLSSVTEAEFQSIVTKRDTLKSQFKDFRKSQAAKQAWTKNRSSMLTAIRRAKGSLKGKKATRTATRTLLTKTKAGQSQYKTRAHEALLAVSSIKTHLLLETQYLLPHNLSLEYDCLLETALPLLIELEQAIFSGKDIPTEALTMLEDLIGTKS